VHPEILRNEGLSEELRDEKTIWEERYRSMVDLERHLYCNGTRTIKIFLHLSMESSENASSSVLMSLIRTGNSASPTFTRENIGRIM